jgi:hypothetical protein
MVILPKDVFGSSVGPNIIGRYIGLYCGIDLKVGVQTELVSALIICLFTSIVLFSKNESF